MIALHGVTQAQAHAPGAKKKSDPRNQLHPLCIRGT
jgi:hypothetical protein